VIIITENDDIQLGIPGLRIGIGEKALACCGRWNLRVRLWNEAEKSGDGL
jgi:hypothetical protein